MFAVAKLNKQNEQTWVNLQRRLNSVQFSYSNLFPNDQVYRFVKNKAISLGSSEGYFVPSLLTTTAFGPVNARVDSSTHEQPVNLFTIFLHIPAQISYSLFL